MGEIARKRDREGRGFEHDLEAALHEGTFWDRTKLHVKLFALGWREGDRIYGRIPWPIYILALIVGLISGGLYLLGGASLAAIGFILGLLLSQVIIWPHVRRVWNDLREWEELIADGMKSELEPPDSSRSENTRPD